MRLTSCALPLAVTVLLLITASHPVAAFTPMTCQEFNVIRPKSSFRKISSAPPPLSSSSPLLPLGMAKMNDDDCCGNAPPCIQSTRRLWLQTTAASTVSPVVGITTTTTAVIFPIQYAHARELTDATSGNLPDFPPEAVRSYLQYRYPLQLAADYYIFDLQSLVRDTDSYGEVNDLVTSKGSRGGGGGASRIERDYVNPMRIIGLSMPPDVADDIRECQFAFERAMAKLTKATGGIRRGLSVEIDKKVVIPRAMDAWEDGRVALNSFFVTLNKATGLEDELRIIPPAGPDQLVEYGRSVRRYNEFTKKTRLCQNRGGPTLSAAWGQLMVSGYLQDSCGVEPLEGYFFQ